MKIRVSIDECKEIIIQHLKLKGLKFDPHSCFMDYQQQPIGEEYAPQFLVGIEFTLLDKK